MATTVPTNSTENEGSGDGAPNEKEKCLIHEHFTEVDEVKQLITGLNDIWQDTIAMETSEERFHFIIDDYQEQPHLIDPYLEELLNMTLKIAITPETPKPVSKQAFSYLYLITKMRGFKHVVRLLPHEVTDMEPLLALLEAQDPKIYQLWETRYILLLWLSIVCMIPFDLKRLDSSHDEKDGVVKPKTMDRIMTICKTYLSVSDKCRDAAAYLLSRFLTRMDVRQEVLPQSLDWMMSTLKQTSYETGSGRDQLCGVLANLAQLFKIGKREDLLPYASIVLNVTLDSKLHEASNCVIRKLVGKLVHRLGLTFMKVRVASWRYQRGSRSLAANLGGGATEVTQGGENRELLDEDEDDMDVPEEIESVVESMLKHLKDKETVVRWTAAKGIGRMTGRLPCEFADEVVGSVLDNFSYQESDGAWHGGCLALAELGRRGLLLPARLKDVVPVIIKALNYDEKRGNFSIGAHVRDAACYVCWAFARAYDPKEINPYVQQISNCLIIVSVFDREVNVRRAASAAFQENVGRQGTFPHGIDILTTVDYFAVGSRPRCYLELSVFVAQFKEYTRGIIDHLLDVKLAHWDSVIRELSAKALSKLTAIDPEYMAKTVVPKLLTMTSGLDLFKRHGAILGIAEIVYRLSEIAKTRNISLTSFLGQTAIEDIESLTKKLEDAKMFRRHGGEFMRTSVCCLIGRSALSKLPFHNKPVIDLWLSVISECLKHIEPEIQAAAVSAIPSFLSEYFTGSDGNAMADKQESVVSLFLKEIQSSNEKTRQGHCLAVGALPLVMLKGQVSRVIHSLIETIKIKEKQEQMAEARRDAVIALSSVCKTVGVQEDGDKDDVLNSQGLEDVYQALFGAMKDYTLDSRGDIGACGLITCLSEILGSKAFPALCSVMFGSQDACIYWRVREASMQALHDLTCLVTLTSPKMLTPSIIQKLFCCLVQQAVEKIDRTRNLAGVLFNNLLYHSPPLPHIPSEEKVKEIFSKDKLQWINWAIEADTFPLFSSLLVLPQFIYSLLVGMSVSVGGLTESIVKYSSASLQDYLRSLSGDTQALIQFMQVLLTVFKDYQRDDRVSVPLMKTLDHMLSWGVLDGLPLDVSDSIPMQIFSLVKVEMHKCGKPMKIMAAADVYCGLLQFEGYSRTKSLGALMILLCHSYPRVRKTTSGKLYEALMTYDEAVPAENMDEVMTILSETTWDDTDMGPIKEKRNEICDLLCINRPTPIKVLL